MQSFKCVIQRRRLAPYERILVKANSISHAEKKMLEGMLPLLSIEPVEGKKRPLFTLNLTQKLRFMSQMQLTQDIQMRIVTALEHCVTTSVTKKEKDLMTFLAKGAADGKSLHDVMRDSGAFDELTLGLIDSGEKSGTISKSFGQLKFLMERSATIKKKLISIMIPPAILLCVAIGSIYTLMLTTIPVFVQMYAQSKMELPIPTQILMGASGVVTKYPIPTAVVCAAVVYLVLSIPKIYRKFPSLHPFVMQIPCVGQLLKKSIQATFARTLADTLRAQTRIVDALGMCKSISVNYTYKSVVARAIVNVSSGRTLGMSLKDDGNILSTILVKAILFGEETGKLEDVLDPLAVALDRELTEYIDLVKVLMEPLITVVVSGVVLLITLALFIPIFNMPNMIK